MKEIDKNKGVYITYVGADEVTGKDCNRATFRWTLPTFGAVNTVLRPLIQQNPKCPRDIVIRFSTAAADVLDRNLGDCRSLPTCSAIDEKREESAAGQQPENAQLLIRADFVETGQRRMIARQGNAK